MSEKRHKWAEAFISGHFFARMRSTQRCEGMNRYMKGYLKSGVKLFELIPALDRALLRLRNRVVEEDFRSNNSTHVLTTQLKNLEHHAATIFTDSVFEHVRKEIDRVGSLIISRSMPFGSIRLFFTSRYNSNNLQNEYTTFYYPKDNHHMECSCTLFECEGIPCSHMFNIMKHEHMTEIPSSLVLKRWTKSAKSDMQTSIPINNVPNEAIEFASFDTDSSSIELHGKTMEVCYSDFKQIMSVPEGGSTVDLRGSIDEPNMKPLLDFYIGKSGNITISDLIDKLEGANAADDNFKVSFILLALGTLLCPNTSTNIHPKYLLALRNPENIRHLNWATFSFEFLLDGVRLFKQSNSKYVSGCVLFLQLYYYNVIGYGRTLVDCSKPIITAWGEDESGKLIKWISRKGGYESRNIMLVGKGDSATGRKHEVEEVIVLRNDVQSMKSVITLIEKAITELGGIVREIKDELFKAVKGDGKDVSIQGDQPNHKGKDTQGNQPNHESTYIQGDQPNHNRKDADAIASDIYKDNSQKLNAKMTDFSPQTSNDIQNNESASCEIYSDDDFGATQVMHKEKHISHKRFRTETASIEFSPINTRRAAKRKPRQQISSPYVDIEKKLDCLNAKLAHGRTTNVKSISGFRGPFNLEDDDVHLLSYVFEEYDDNFVVFKTADDYLNRLDIRCLEPGKLVSNKLINAVLGILRERWSSNWFYSTYFSVTAINAAKEGGDTLLTFAATAKKRFKAIFRYYIQLQDCSKIFIPILDDGTDPYHWFLMVVKIVSKEVEIWDTCPSDTRTIPRTDFVYHLLKALDMIFDSEIAACYDKAWSFCSFTVFRPNYVPIQPNTFDCGIFLIKFMEDYENASKAGVKYYSVNERLRIALMLLKYSHNLARNDIDEAIEQDVQETCLVRTKKTKTIQAKDTAINAINNTADDKSCVMKKEKNIQLELKEPVQTMQRRGPGRPRGAKNKPKKGTTDA